MRPLAVILLCLVIYCGVCSTYRKKLKVSIFYESLCVASGNFIHKQLFPTWYAYQKCADLEFLPYGKANLTRGHHHQLNFTCPHGPNECLGNKLQACVISYLRRKEVDTLMKVITCLMGNNNQTDVLPECVKNTKLKAQKIISCAEGKKGDRLLATLAYKTNRILPHIAYVPTIVFNNVFDESESKAAESNLNETMQKHVPDWCKP